MQSLQQQQKLLLPFCWALYGSTYFKMRVLTSWTKNSDAICSIDCWDVKKVNIEILACTPVWSHRDVRKIDWDIVR